MAGTEGEYIDDEGNENGNNNQAADGLTARHVLSLIELGTYTIVERNDDVRGSARQKSIVWRTFKKIKDTTGEFIDFVACSECNEILKYKNKGGTTSLLIKHIRSKCPARPSDANDDEIQSSPTKARRRLSFNSQTKNTASSSQEQDLSYLAKHQTNKLKSEVTNRIATLCAKDIRTFNIACSDQFIQLAQTLIDIGHKYGKISAKDIIPSSERTISAYIDKVYKEILHNRVLPDIKEPIDSGKISFLNILVICSCEANLLSPSSRPNVFN